VPITRTPIVCVIPGDLHLTDAGLENHQTALWMVNEVNRLVRPDFVQFIGDNVQDAATNQFLLFRSLCDQLQVPWFALVGDHDVCKSTGLKGFREFVGESYGSFRLRGYRFVRLNTLEHIPLGLSSEQLHWFGEELTQAELCGERVVVFQHHYPFKVCETFSGPGIAAWRSLVQTRRIASIFTGHTHYGQIANDGRNTIITTRSIGDPEGGRPGYQIVYLDGDDLAITYRSVDDGGRPIVLITHPRRQLLATGPAHVVSGRDRCSVRIWSENPLREVRGRFDEGEWFALERESDDTWTCPLPAEEWKKGGHLFEAQAIDALGQADRQRIDFPVDATGRYTAIPGVYPYVASTAFC
jgi:Icc protein